MFGRYPFGGGAFGRSPISTALVYLFGVIRTTSLRAIDGARRLMGLDQARTMTDTTGPRRVANRNEARTLRPGDTRRVLGLALSASLNAPHGRAPDRETAFGVFRM